MLPAIYVVKSYDCIRKTMAKNTNCGFRFYGCSMGSIRMMDMGMTSCSQCPENQLEK